MFKTPRNVFAIKTSPYNDNEKLENLLNEMSKDGWDLYSMQEIEKDSEDLYNCIFVKEIEDSDSLLEESGLADFRPRIERIISPELEPYDLCLDILKKIKDKRRKIAQVKELIDSTSEDSRSVLNDEISKYILELDELKQSLIKVINPDIMESKLGEDKLSICVSEELAPLLDSCSEETLLSQIILARQNLTEKTGFIIPNVKIDIDDSLDENEFSVKVRGIPAVNSYAYCSHSMFIKKELNIDSLPENSVSSIDEISGLETVWINSAAAEDYWIKGLSAAEYIASIAEYVCIKYIDDIFDYSDAGRYMETAGSQNLYLVDNIIPEFLSVSELKYILCCLIKEKVSIKDIVFIFEKLNDLSYIDDKETLLARLRAALNRQISSSLCTSKEKIIYAHELSPETLKIFYEIDDLNEGRDIINIETGKTKAAVKKIQAKQNENSIGADDLILIAPADIRHFVYQVLSHFLKGFRVISRDEIASDCRLQINSLI